MKSEVYKPPFKVPHNNCPKVFLGGSIEQGKAANWQDEIVKSFPFNVNFLNPRRDSWDDTWVQDINNPNFFEQVTWELDMLDMADIIVMYFDPSTLSPISLLELGLYCSAVDYRYCSNKLKMLVCCPEGFWRKGNVDIVCQRYGVPMFNNMETLIVSLKSKIG